MLYRVSFAGLALALFAWASLCQQTSTSDPTQPGTVQTSENTSPPRESKRILGVIPNYRTSPSLLNYEPLTTREKFKMAT